MPKKRLDAALFRDWLGKEIKDFLKTGESQMGIVWTVGDKYPLQIMPVYLVLLLFYWERHEVHSCR